MNKKKILIPLAVLLILSGLVAIAGNYHWFGLNIVNKTTADLPDAKEELKKLYTVYSNPDSAMHIEGTIRLFDRENEDAFKEEAKFSYSRKGKQLFSELGPIQSVMADSIIVQLDTANKYILVSKIDGAAELPAQAAGLPFEKFMQDTSAFKIEAAVSEKGKERALTIKSELNPEIKSSTLYYDPATYRISHAEIEWWKEAIVYKDEDSQKKTWLSVIRYTYPLSSGKSAAEEIKKIIVINKEGKAEPAKAYNDYSIRSSF
jgi:hypothetical protein